jgi:hypothetical protein
MPVIPTAEEDATLAGARRGTRRRRGSGRCRMALKIVARGVDKEIRRRDEESAAD